MSVRYTSYSIIFTEPLVRGISDVSTLKVVDFPAPVWKEIHLFIFYIKNLLPLGPSSPKISPRSTPKLVLAIANFPV
jgi:hypothetical protein